MTQLLNNIHVHPPTTHTEHRHQTAAHLAHGITKQLYVAQGKWQMGSSASTLFIRLADVIIIIILDAKLSGNLVGNRI